MVNPPSCPSGDEPPAAKDKETVLPVSDEGAEGAAVVKKRLFMRFKYRLFDIVGDELILELLPEESGAVA